jgi:glyoxylase-like metal-dependent hydrolase (beta-lactamase superfamily II)/rhodanese-related sulfurtransferase
MKIEQLYTGCLAHGAYYIESNGEAAVIDPLREVQQYIDMANERNAKIKYVFETHFHADFVSGHIDLSKKTGAPIIYGPTTMQTGFDITVAKDEQEFQLGNVTIKLLHTPGHTTESSCYLLIDEHGNEKALFSGDTLFIGDVGRPDLAQKVIAELTQDKLARMLYYSLRDKIVPLDDDVIVYPGHGAGSACGKNMSKETTDTLGNQKRTNYALQPMTEDEFVAQLLDGLTPPLAYFPHNVLMNIKGYESIDEVVTKGTKALSATEFEIIAQETNAVIIDTRSEENFVKGFIPNSIFIGIDGSFATWVGTILKDVSTPVIYIADEGREKEIAIRMARIGFDNNLGYLKGGVNAWIEAGKPIETLASVSPEELAEKSEAGEALILDVRKASEYGSQHIINAENTPLDYIDNEMAKIAKDKTYYVHCAGGYRSVIFASILKSKGYNNLINVEKGFKGIEATGRFALTEYVCPTTML